MDKETIEIDPGTVVLRLRTVIAFLVFVGSIAAWIFSATISASGRLTTLEERVEFGKSQRVQLETIVQEMRGDIKQQSHDIVEVKGMVRELYNRGTR